MSKTGLNYKGMRDDQIHFWLQYLRNEASQEHRDRYIHEAADEAFRRGIIGEKWLSYYKLEKEAPPWQEWKDD